MAILKSSFVGDSAARWARWAIFGNEHWSERDIPKTMEDLYQSVALAIGKASAEAVDYAISMALKNDPDYHASHWDNAELIRKACLHLTLPHGIGCIMCKTTQQQLSDITGFAGSSLAEKIHVRRCPLCELLEKSWNLAGHYLDAVKAEAVLRGMDRLNKQKPESPFWVS